MSSFGGKDAKHWDTKGEKANAAPATATGEEGSAKRNIERKGTGGAKSSTGVRKPGFGGTDAQAVDEMGDVPIEKGDPMYDDGEDAALNPEEGDEILDCRDCCKRFLFTKGEQDFYAEKGFEGKPTRCKECRAANKAKRSGRGESGASWGGGGGGRGVCYAFQAGNCDRGDACRFSHDPNAAEGGDIGGSKGGKGGKGGKGKGGKGKGGKGGGVCYAFQKGECTRGDECRFSHTTEA